jgi:Rrf2 family protein
MWLSRTVMYGVHAALLLGNGTLGKSVACSELAGVGHMPERFLLQILRSMVTHGILISTRGVNGGYVLARSLQEISVLDVMDAVEGPSEHASSPSPFLSIQSQAILNKAFHDNSDTFRTAYSGISLSQLVLAPHEQLHAHKYGISN